MIYIKNNIKKITINNDYVKNTIKEILKIIYYPNFDVSIWFTTNATIKKFNKKFRHKNKSTDILSFPFYPELKPGNKIKARNTDEQNLGDILISLERCKKDSKELKIPFKKYLIKIIVHGIVHLLGYNHITDKQYKEMKQVEGKILKSIL